MCPERGVLVSKSTASSSETSRGSIQLIAKPLASITVMVCDVPSVN
jgi:hypothetical protein